MTSTKKPSTLFWVVAVLALLWNLIGVFQFIASTFMKDFIYEGLSSEELELMNALPSWYTIFFGIATIAGLLACITMLMRKKITVILFLISLLGVMVVQGYWLVGTNTLEVMGTQAVIMPLLVIVISVYLYFYNKRALMKGLLH